MRSKTWFIKIRSALPPGDECARLIARALVLLADLRIEQPGIHEDELRVLERSGTFYRRMYFLRGIATTLRDVEKLAAAIAGSKAFAELFDWSSESRAAFDSALANLTKHSAVIKTVRNAIGAHVERQVQMSVDTIPENYGAKMEFSSEDGLRPHVAEWLLLAALFEGASEEDLEPRFLAVQRDLHDAASAALELLAAAIDTYALRHPLFPS